MKKTLLLLLAALISTCALAKSDVKYSPYADLSLDVHWDANTQSLQPTDLTKVSNESGVKNYHLAFITDAGSCKPAWGGQADYSVEKAWAKPLTDKMKAAGLNYVISLGGANGTDISKFCNENELTSKYEEIIRTYLPQGLDFDIENGTADVLKIVNALKRIQHTHPDIKFSFTLPVMPEGLTAEGQNIVKQAQAASLNFSVNIMAMDYGSSYTADMGEYAIQAATQLFNFLQSIYPQKSTGEIWSMVEVTPMIGVNDISVEQFTLKNTDTLRNFANQNKLAGLAMWSISRDQPCADKWANNHCSGNNLQTKAYEFSQRFLG